MSRRASGEGSAIQYDEARDSFWTQASLGFVNGRRIRRTIRGATQKDVLDQLDKERAAYKRTQRLGLARDLDKKTLAEYLTFWLESVVRNEVTPATYRSYEQQIRCHIIPTLGHVKLCELRPQHIRELLAAKAKTNLSARSVAYIRAVLRSALGSAISDDIIADNVASRVRPPKGEEKEVESLTVDQCRTLLEAVCEERWVRWAALIKVGIGLGLRQGEQLALCWDHVDFEARELRVQWNLQRIKLPGEKKRSEHLCAPKRHSRRTIVLPDVVLDALHAHRELQQRERELCGSRWRDQVVHCEGKQIIPDFVFRMPTGSAIEGCYINKLFKRLLVACGIPPRNHHSARHTAATLLLLQGVQPRVVMQILGWKDARMLTRYGHVLREMQTQAASAMDEVLAPRPPKPEEPEPLASKLASRTLLHRVK